MKQSEIPRRKLSHEILDRLREAIWSGTLPPGAHLPSERELMDRYGVGRPAVREALQTLERAGIISISHGERARVTIPTASSLIDQVTSGARHLLQVEPHSLEHLKDARLFLEVGMARRAAEAASPEAVARLEGLHRELVTSLESLDGFLDKDMAFHREIAALSGNPIFPAIVEGMFSWLAEYYTQLVRAPGAEKLTIREHGRILAAIKAGDPDAAAKAMREHLTRANKLYRRLERK